MSLNDSFGYFGDLRKMGNYTVVGEVFFIERGIFRSDVTKEDVSGMGRCLWKEKGRQYKILQMVDARRGYEFEKSCWIYI